MTHPIQWAWPKAVLLFLGLICKGLATSEPLPFWWGTATKAIAGILWPAIDGAFFWLLTPPKQSSEPEEEDTTHEALPGDRD
jgi:hypothetical protein